MHSIFTSLLRALSCVRLATEPHPESWGSVSRRQVPRYDCHEDTMSWWMNGHSGHLENTQMDYFLNVMEVWVFVRRQVRPLVTVSFLEQRCTWIHLKHGIWSHQTVFVEEVYLETECVDRKLDLPSRGQCGCSEGPATGSNLGWSHLQLWPSCKTTTAPLPGRGCWLPYFHEESKLCRPRCSGIWMTTELHLAKVNWGFLLSNQEKAEPDLAGAKDD